MKSLHRGPAIAAALALAGLALGIAFVGPPNAAVAQPKPDIPAKPKSELTADLALVPGNAGGFIHVQVAKIWKTDAMKEIRKIAERAGPKALKALDADFKPMPSTLERVTMVLLPLPEKGARVEPKIITILAFNEPFVADDVRKLYLPKAEPKKAGGKEYFADEIQGVSLLFADDRTVLKQANVGGYDIAVCDFALAAALHLTGQKPADYGFTVQNLNPTMQANYTNFYFRGDMTATADAKSRAAFARWREYEAGVTGSVVGAPFADAVVRAKYPVKEPKEVPKPKGVEDPLVDD